MKIVIINVSQFSLDNFGGFSGCMGIQMFREVIRHDQNPAFYFRPAQYTRQGPFVVFYKFVYVGCYFVALLIIKLLHGAELFRAKSLISIATKGKTLNSSITIMPVWYGDIVFLTMLYSEQIIYMIFPFFSLPHFIRTNLHKLPVMPTT